MNLLANLPQTLPEELTTVLQKGNGLRIERMVSTGTARSFRIVKHR